MAKSPDIEKLVERAYKDIEPPAYVAEELAESLPATRVRPRRAWVAIRTRIGPEGRLVDVCTGTGKQESLHAYYDRTAILGRDARGGAMTLMVATEMARWEKESTAVRP